MQVKIDFQNLSKKDKLRGLKIPPKITPNLAYLCGIFAGDGSINFREKKKEYSIKCVGNPKDEKPFYRKIIEIFGNILSIYPKLVTDFCNIMLCQ